MHHLCLISVVQIDRRPLLAEKTFSSTCTELCFGNWAGRLHRRRENVGRMRVLIFGATGMVGQGVLRECLLDPLVTAVQTVGRSATGVHHPKLREIVRADLFLYSDIEAELVGFNACFFCLGVSAGRVSKEEYERLTYTLTLATASIIFKRGQRMCWDGAMAVSRHSCSGSGIPRK